MDTPYGSNGQITLLLIILLLGMVAWLTVEVRHHNRNLKKIPLRITVSGTRGKTTVVRSLASILRLAGYQVLAKTTGSEARLILPDGTEEPIKRNGLTTIMEQKKLINKAKQLQAQCVIAEIMSIQPTNHLVETQQLLKPQMTLLTNFRTDHTDVVPDRQEAITAVFANDVFPDSAIILPETEANPQIREAIENKKARLIMAKSGIHSTINLPDNVLEKQIASNLDLVTTAALELGIEPDVIAKGIALAKMDIGNPLIFSIKEQNKNLWFINAFAANDPQSTRQLVEQTEALLSAESGSRIALLSLRSDRGERSLQWLRYLRGEGRELFEKVYLVGGHAQVLKRSLPTAVLVKQDDPRELTKLLITNHPDGSRVYGIGNIGGLGAKLVREWIRNADER